MFFRIIDTDKNDSGQYKCELANQPLKVVSKDAVLEILEKTKIIEKAPETVVLVEGDPVNLECQASSDPKLVDSLSIHWKFNETIISTESELLEFHEKNHIDISIKSARLQDSGYE